MISFVWNICLEINFHNIFYNFYFLLNIPFRNEEILAKSTVRSFLLSKCSSFAPSGRIPIHRYDTACARRKWRILRRMGIKKIWPAIVIWTSENLGWCGGGRRDRGSRRDERHRGLSYPRVHDTQVPHCCVVVRIGVALLCGWWRWRGEQQENRD